MNEELRQFHATSRHAHALVYAVTLLPALNPRRLSHAAMRSQSTGDSAMRPRSSAQGESQARCGTNSRSARGINDRCRIGARLVEFFPGIPQGTKRVRRFEQGPL